MDEHQLQRLKEAQKDNSWVKKIRMAQTTDELVRLYEEKGIALKEEISAHPINETRILDDEELDEVAGGGLFGDCPKEYNFLLCELSMCPHVKKADRTPTEYEATVSCDNGHWQYTCKYDNAFP